MALDGAVDSAGRNSLGTLAAAVPAGISNDVAGRAVALSCQGITKVFPVVKEANLWRILFNRPAPGRTITALHDISLTVPVGKFVGVLGHNGAGKSTLLRILGGVYTPTRGTVGAHGSVSGLFELGGIGNRFLTGREYARRSLAIQGAHPREFNRLISEIQDFSELEQAFDNKIQTYSSGMAARLYFATATALQHQVYLIDELLAVGDEHFQAKCWIRMRERLFNGASGVLVTHDWSSILKICEHSHIMERGRIVESGPSDRVVVSHLGLEPPKATIARFSPTLPSEFHAVSGADAEVRFQIEILENQPVALAYSVEMLRIGVGWEILLLGDNRFVADSRGRYDVILAFPRLPLAAGHYSLSLFLHKYQHDRIARQHVVFDTRSWTIGNGLRLHVDGPAASGPIMLPLVWECLT